MTAPATASHGRRPPPPLNLDACNGSNAHSNPSSMFAVRAIPTPRPSPPRRPCPRRGREGKLGAMATTFTDASAVVGYDGASDWDVDLEAQRHSHLLHSLTKSPPSVGIELTDLNSENGDSAHGSDVPLETQEFLPRGHTSQRPRSSRSRVLYELFRPAVTATQELKDKVIDATWVLKTTVMRLAIRLDEWAVDLAIRWLDGNAESDFMLRPPVGEVDDEMGERDGVDFDDVVAGGAEGASEEGIGVSSIEGTGWGWIGRVDVLERLYLKEMASGRLQRDRDGEATSLDSQYD